MTQKPPALCASGPGIKAGKEIEMTSSANEHEGEQYLPFSAPSFESEERQELLAALDSDWITTGPRTQQFEKAFAAYVGAVEAVAVNSCTAALHLALVALNVGDGDAVITTPFTFA